jgi:membrane protein YdbS with pleckstrin-like domain
VPDIFESKRIKEENHTQNKSEAVLESDSIQSKAIKESFPNTSTHKIDGHSHNPLAAYCYYPDHVKFINEDPEEKVILLLRKHPVTNISWISIVFLMAIAPSFLPLFSFFELLPWGFQLIFILIWYLIIIAFSLEKFLSWFFHVNIVTDERIIEVDFVNLFYREITDANIDQIQDVTVEIGGAIRTFLHFGDLVIQTASEIPKIEFEDIPIPDHVAKILRELRIEEETEKLEGRIR